MQKIENKVLEFLKSPLVIIFALLLALVVQTSHSFWAYVKIDPLEQDTTGLYVWALFFAVGISFSIVIHTVYRVIWVAYVYLVIEFGINLIYYDITSRDLKSGITVVLFSLFIPFTISRYSELMKSILAKLEETKKQQEFEVLENKIVDLQNTVEKELSKDFPKRFNMKLGEKYYNNVELIPNEK